MKRILLCLLAASAIAGVSAKKQVPRKVQGVDYTLVQDDGKLRSASDWEWSEPGDMPAPDGEFTFDMIKSWTGTGENRAALVIQWNYDDEPTALVFGYRWDGMATGADMIRAVVAANPRLYGLIQYTNVSSPTDPLGGYTINGFGWDLDNDGDIRLIDTGKGNQEYTAADGLFIHPRGYDPNVGGTSDYDYDNWKAGDGDDWWQAGWYIGYWSYWVKDDYESKFGYSGWGASGRVLVDGSWDGWNYAVDMMSSPWKEFQAAPALIPDGAKTEFEYNGLYYSLLDYSRKTVKVVAPEEITGFATVPYEGVVTIPASFTDSESGETYTVSEVGDKAFANSAVVSVALPSSVTKIGVSAFEGSSLTSLTDGMGGTDFAHVSSIGERAFAGCAGFSTVVIPAKMTSIPAGLFEGTAITDIVFPATVENIGTSAFADCLKLKSIEFPATLKGIGSAAFAGCDSLMSIVVNSTLPLAITDDTFSEKAYADATIRVPLGYRADYAAAEGWKNFVNYNEFTIGVEVGDIFRYEGVTYQVTSASESTATVKATYCKVDGKPDAAKIKAANSAGYKGNLIIPATVPYQNIDFKVTEINDSAFYEANQLNGITILAPVTKIGKHTFYDCTSLMTVTLPETLTSIETYAFSYAEKLEYLHLPESVETLGVRAFFQCNALQSINVPAAVKEIPEYCFSYCKALEELTFSDNVEKFGGNAMQQCVSLKKVVLPAGLKALPASIFSNCTSLCELKLPESLETIGNSAFANCPALPLEIPAGVTSIGTEAFRGNKVITEFVVPAAMTSIPASLFYDCSNLRKVTMSAAVTSIGQSSFRGCTSLEEISLVGTPTAAVSSKPGELMLPEGLTSLGSYAFSGCEKFTSVVIPDGVTTLSTYTFTGATNLAEVKLPSKLKTLSGWAFQNTALTEITLPATVTSMPNANIFFGCPDIKVFVCNPVPSTATAYALRTKGTTTANSTWALPIVPVGTADAYKAKTGWKQCPVILEPEFSSMSPEVTGVVVEDSTVTVNARLNAVYTVDFPDAAASRSAVQNLPEDFVAANNKIVLAGAAPVFKWRVAGGEGEYTEVPATMNADGTISFTMPAPEKNSKLEVMASATVNDTSFEGQPSEVEVIVEQAPRFAFANEEYDAHFDEQFDVPLVFNDETLSLSDFNLTSSNPAVASVVARTGRVTVKRVEGDAVITASLKADESQKAEMTIHAALRNPVERIVLGDGESEINMTYLDIMALRPVVYPENADVQTYDIEISDSEIATTYSVTAFNPTSKFFELVTHKVGEFDLTFKSQDGSGVKTVYHVKVNDPDRTPASDGYQDGTFWLNEDWFGHTNGSINYITKDKDVIYRAYEAQNPYESFGCTSQYATIHGDKLIVMSKQATDGGDPRKGGGRVVVADAKTLKKLASFDEIGGDGRACVGVSENKVYLGSTGGIRILNTSTMELGDMVQGIPGGSLYANQLGDMVCAGNYVFVIQQATGLHIINTDTDTVEKFYGLAATDDAEGIGYPQGVAQSADGNVWVAATEKASTGLCTLYCFDPQTLEIIDSVTLPDGQRITCGWGAWRSSNFFASTGENALWWGTGVDNQIYSGNTGYYKWTIGSDVNELAPVFVFPSKLEGKDEKTFQSPYATVRYDERSNELLVAATHGASSNYRYTWLHFVDCATGEISKTIRLKDYYWFPAIPVFPDKHAPEFGEIDDIEISIGQNVTDDFVLDLSELVTDKDHNDYNIKISHVAASAPVSRGAATSLGDIADVKVDGKTVTITPIKEGKATLSLQAQSNGKTTLVDIPVSIFKTSGVDGVSEIGGTITVTGRRVNVKGMEGCDFFVYDMAGSAVAAFHADSDDVSVVLAVPSGVYVVASADGRRAVKVSIK